MLEIAFLGLSFITVFLFIYGLYFFWILGKNSEISEFQKDILCLQKSKEVFEDVSVIISTYNEAEVIERKLENISELNYPKEKMEILVLDDASTDKTAELASRKIAEKKLLGKVIRNKNRIGLNQSLNMAIEKTKHDLICITDSDVMLEKNSLRNAMCVLKGFREAGGVTGKIQPVFKGKGVAQSNESIYRGFYDKMMIAESTMHSAFPGNGPLVIFDKTKVCSSIPVEYGSSDGNIAINVIKSGLRFIYVPNAIIFEPVPENLGQQRLQKVRRAQRLIQVFFHNRDIFLNKKFYGFGRKIFPLKFLIVSLCPLIGLFGLSLIITSILISQSFILYEISLISIAVFAALLLFNKKLRNTISSFVFHQIYLIAGLILSLRKSIYWRTIDRDSHIPLEEQGVENI
jgi:cellulose synthase/poly-beta-1,6-N-acetylglucosamine synthase-like glycosyltransferase